MFGAHIGKRTGAWRKLSGGGINIFEKQDNPRTTFKKDVAELTGEEIAEVQLPKKYYQTRCYPTVEFTEVPGEIIIPWTDAEAADGGHNTITLAEENNQELPTYLGKIHEMWQHIQPGQAMIFNNNPDVRVVGIDVTGRRVTLSTNVAEQWSEMDHRLQKFITFTLTRVEGTCEDPAHTTRDACENAVCDEEEPCEWIPPLHCTQNDKNSCGRNGKCLDRELDDAIVAVGVVRVVDGETRITLTDVGDGGYLKGSIEEGDRVVKIRTRPNEEIRQEEEWVTHMVEEGVVSRAYPEMEEVGGSPVLIAVTIDGLEGGINDQLQQHAYVEGQNTHREVEVTFAPKPVNGTNANKVLVGDSNGNFEDPQHIESQGAHNGNNFRLLNGATTNTKRNCVVNDTSSSNNLRHCRDNYKPTVVRFSSNDQDDDYRTYEQVENYMRIPETRDYTTMFKYCYRPHGTCTRDGVVVGGECTVDEECKNGETCDREEEAAEREVDITAYGDGNDIGEYANATSLVVVGSNGSDEYDGTQLHVRVPPGSIVKNDRIANVRDSMSTEDEEVISQNTVRVLRVQQEEGYSILTLNKSIFGKMKADGTTFKNPTSESLARYVWAQVNEDPDRTEEGISLELSVDNSVPIAELIEEYESSAHIGCFSQDQFVGRVSEVDNAGEDTVTISRPNATDDVRDAAYGRVENGSTVVFKPILKITVDRTDRIERARAASNGNSPTLEVLHASYRSLSRDDEENNLGQNGKCPELKRLQTLSKQDNTSNYVKARCRAAYKKCHPNKDTEQILNACSDNDEFNDAEGNCDALRESWRDAHNQMQNVHNHGRWTTGENSDSIIRWPEEHPYNNKFYKSIGVREGRISETTAGFNNNGRCVNKEDGAGAADHGRCRRDADCDGAYYCKKDTVNMISHKQLKNRAVEGYEKRAKIVKAREEGRCTGSNTPCHTDDECEGGNRCRPGEGLLSKNNMCRIIGGAIWRIMNRQDEARAWDYFMYNHRNGQPTNDLNREYNREIDAVAMGNGRFRVAAHVDVVAANVNVPFQFCYKITNGDNAFEGNWGIEIETREDGKIITVDGFQEGVQGEVQLTLALPFWPMVPYIISDAQARMRCTNSFAGWTTDGREITVSSYNNYPQLTARELRINEVDVDHWRFRVNKTTYDLTRMGCFNYHTHEFIGVVTTIVVAEDENQQWVTIGEEHRINEVFDALQGGENRTRVVFRFGTHGIKENMVAHTHGIFEKVCTEADDDGNEVTCTTDNDCPDEGTCSNVREAANLVAANNQQPTIPTQFRDIVTVRNINVGDRFYHPVMFMHNMNKAKTPHDIGGPFPFSMTRLKEAVGGRYTRDTQRTNRYASVQKHWVSTGSSNGAYGLPALCARAGILKKGITRSSRKVRLKSWKKLCRSARISRRDVMYPRKNNELLRARKCNDVGEETMKDLDAVENDLEYFVAYKQDDITNTGRRAANLYQILDILTLNDGDQASKIEEIIKRKYVGDWDDKDYSSLQQVCYEQFEEIQSELEAYLVQLLSAAKLHSRPQKVTPRVDGPKKPYYAEYMLNSTGDAFVLSNVRKNRRSRTVSHPVTGEDLLKAIAYGLSSPQHPRDPEDIWKDKRRVFSPKTNAS